MTEPSPRGLLRWRRRFAASLALVAAIAVVIGVVLGSRSPASSQDASSHHDTSGVSTATVQRRDLVATDTESGTLSYASPQTVYNRLTGTITWLPSVGQVIKRGEALYRVNGAPVILMDGTTPAYRDLNGSDTAGQDILQLNRNLVALGFNPDGIVIDDVWQAATTAGVELFQESLGEAETGDLKLGQIVFLPGDQLVSAVDATLGSDGSGGGSSPGGSSSTAGTPIATPQFVGLTRTVKPKPQSHRKPKHGSSKAKTLAALIALLKAEIAQLRAENAGPRGNSSAGSHGAGSPTGGGSRSGGGSPSAGGSPGAGGSPSGGDATAILQTSSTHLVATVDLDATKQREARVGERVTVEMPSGDTVDGRVTAVSPVAQSSSGSDNGGSGGGGGGGGGNGGGGNGSSGSTIPVTIALSGHRGGAGLDQAAVSVNFAQAQAANVLSVPVTALLATPGGGYAVQEAASPRALIPVTTGLFAAGYVQISGQGIYAGLEVTNSQG